MAAASLILLGAAACVSGFVPARPLMRSSPARSSALRMSAEEFDYDVAIVGCGVGGHGAALHARARGLKTLVLSGGAVGGTCVNRGCVPSKALLAAAGRVREMSDEKHLSALGIQVEGEVSYDRAGVAAHASQLVAKVRGGLEGSLKNLGVDVIEAPGELVAPQTLKAGAQTIKAKDIILAPGSLPFVPPGIETDGKTVFTSDEALDLAWVPEWVAIIGSGYIGLEFSDVYTALGSEVTFIEVGTRFASARRAADTLTRAGARFQPTFRRCRASCRGSTSRSRGSPSACSSSRARSTTGRTCSRPR